MAAPRSNLLALAVLATLAEAPMHRYEIASTIKARAKDQQMAVKLSSLYTVTDNLAKQGLVEITGNDRDGARPERTIFALTSAGLTELRDWTRQLISEPSENPTDFVAGLSVLAALTPDEAVQALRLRSARLVEKIERRRAGLAEVGRDVPRLFLVEDELSLVLLETEARWTEDLLTDLTDGTFAALDLWRDLSSPTVRSPTVRSPTVSSPTV